MFKSNKKSFKILFVAPEAAPFAAAGGLGEVMYSLPRALNKLGHEARLFMPRYYSVDLKKNPAETINDKLVVPAGDGTEIICEVKKNISEDKTTTYLLENDDFYGSRPNIYGYPDDPVRWALLSRSVLEFVRANEDWKPDIIVASDWQSGLVANYIHREYKNDPVLSKIPVVFSIHNISYQGMIDHNFVQEMDYDAGNSEIPSLNDPKLLKLNFMRRGIMYADVINTVSENYAKEIMTPEYGEKLDDLLRERRSRVFGILNGIDYNDKNPEKDPHVEHQFNLKTINKRIKNKTFLQQKFSLPVDKDKVLFGIVSRLTGQKGIDLIIDSIEPLLRNNDFQLAILGSGEGRYMSFFRDLAKKYPKNVSTNLVYDRALSSVILAGADAMLIPSRFEPSGLVQMEAMRYGSIPLVRKTGGLAESVDDYDPEKNIGNGFVFEKYDHYAFYGAIIRVLESYKYKDNWLKLQKRAMSANFSWDISASKYVKLFEKAIHLHKESKEFI